MVGTYPAAISWRKSLHEGTGRIGTCPTNNPHKAFWGTDLRDLEQKFKPVWVRDTSRRDQSCIPATKVWNKNGQFTQWDLSPRLVAETSPLECATDAASSQVARAKINRITINQFSPSLLVCIRILHRNSTMGDKSVQTLISNKIEFLSNLVTFPPSPPKKTMLIFLFLRLHRSQRLHNIELGGRGYQRIDARSK